MTQEQIAHLRTLLKIVDDQVQAGGDVEIDDRVALSEAAVEALPELLDIAESTL